MCPEFPPTLMPPELSRKTEISRRDCFRIFDAMDAFLARQPIFNRDLTVYGYELLFRQGTENFFHETDGDRATASLISDAVHLHSLEKLAGGRRLFINFTRNALLNDLYLMLPSATTVVEVLESLELDEDLLAACLRVKKYGCLLALDDYVLDAQFDPLLSSLDILKVEFPALSQEQHSQVLESSRHYGFHLLAEKVETPEQYQLAKDLGNHYFQGYFFCKPQMLRARRLPQSQLQCMRLLQLISESELDVDRAEELIRNDVALSYNLLRYLNSPVFGQQSEVTTVRRAITVLGREPLRKWISIVALQGLSQEKPPELTTTSLIRARFSELLGRRVLPSELAAECFLVGMFSLLDAMLDQSMPEITKDLSLSDAARTALQGLESPLKRIVDLSIAMERGDWAQISQLVAAISLTEEDVFQLHSESITWAMEMQSTTSPVR